MEDFGSRPLRLLIGGLDRAVVATHADLGDATACVDRTRLVEVMTHLRDQAGFEMLMDVTCVDLLPASPRFEMVYHLYSIAHNDRVRIKVSLEETDAALPSVTPLYASANWMEREVFDLYGIRIDGHPDLRRILLYDAFDGYPLRKDYPKERRQPLVGPRN